MQKLASFGLFGIIVLMLAAPVSAQDEPAPSETSEAAAPEPSDDGQPGFEDLQQEVRDLGQIEITVGSKAMVVSWQGIEVGPQVSSWLREKLDGLEDGSQDGSVSEAEAEAAGTLLKAFIQQEFDHYAHDERFNNYLLIDSTNPSGAEVGGIATSGIVGPVASEEGITLSFAAAIDFATHAADVHTVKLDMGRYMFSDVDASKAEEMVGDFTITVKGAEGWTIDAASIQPECVADNYVEGALIFTIDDVQCFTGHSGVLLGFSITGSDGQAAFLPGFEVVGLLAGVAGAGILIRRRA